MAAGTPSTPTGMDDIEAILDRMENQVLTLGCFPPPSPLLSPVPDACMELLQGPRGPELGKGMTCRVVQCDNHRSYALKIVQSRYRQEWMREVSRTRRLPPLSVLQSVFATVDLVSLMPRLWPLPQHMTAPALVRMKHDISAALELMHQNNMVHADIHAGNIMMRPQPACYVLIDYAGCSGDTVYPLRLGYGAIGFGGSLHRPPHHEAAAHPIRTAYGDFYRLAQCIKAHLSRGERPHEGSRKRIKTLPHHVDKELQHWIDREALPVPNSPSSPFPPGTWIQTATKPQVLVTAFLWNDSGNISRDSAIFTRPDHKFGNKNGTFVDEEVGGMAQGTGTWERSATFAKFYLQGALRTCGTHERAFFQEIYPWQAYSNDDGYLVAENPPPPPPRSIISDFGSDHEMMDKTPTGEGGMAQSAEPDPEQASPLLGIWAPYPPAEREVEATHRTNIRQATKLLEDAIAAIPEEIASMPAEPKKPVPAPTVDFCGDGHRITAPTRAHLGDWAAPERPTGAWALRFAAAVLHDVAESLETDKGQQAPSTDAEISEKETTATAVVASNKTLTPELQSQLG